MTSSSHYTKFTIGILAILLSANSSTGTIGRVLTNFLSTGPGSNLTDSGISQGISLDTWEPPAELKRLFPYYLSGLDKIGQPVWVIEFGKWNIRKFFEDGGDPKIADLYTDQMFYRWNKAEKIRWDYYGGTGNFGLICDFDGYSLSYLLSRPGLRLTLAMTRKFQNLPAAKLAYGNLINMNSVANTLLNVFLKPILQETFARMETSGTNSKMWIPLLIRRIPKTSLPPWYGGVEYHTPIASLG